MAKGQTILQRKKLEKLIRKVIRKSRKTTAIDCTKEGDLHDLNKLAAEVHAANAHWWHDLHTGQKLVRNKGEMLMLMVSELAEAMEGERKSKPGIPLMDDKIPTRRMAEVEMADVVIRALDYAGGHGYKLREATPLPFHEDENRAANLLRIVRLILHVDMLEGYGPEGVDIGYTLSRVISSCARYCEVAGYDLWGALQEKMAVNANRPDHKREARLAAGGKAF